jgi:endoglucanase
MRVVLLGLVLLSCISSFDGRQLPPPTTDIKVDQVGYLPASPKVAMVVARTATGTFVVRRAGDGEIVFRGKLSAPAADASSGDSVQTADFTALKKEGRFYLEVPSVGVSWSFAIAPDAYSRAFYLAMRSFYGQRCGVAVDLGPEL